MSANQQELAPRRESVVFQLGSMALLADHTLQPVLDLGGSDQIGQTLLGGRRLEQAAAVLEALGDRHRPSGGRWLACLLDDIPQLLGQLAMTAARFMGRYLQRNGQKALFVPLEMGQQ